MVRDGKSCVAVESPCSGRPAMVSICNPARSTPVNLGYSPKTRSKISTCQNNCVQPLSQSMHLRWPSQHAMKQSLKGIEYEHTL